MQRNLQQAPGTLTSKDKLPQRRYAVRCIEEVFGQSSKGNGMITRTWEVVDPEAVSINGANKIVAGVQVKQYLNVIVLDQATGARDDEASDKALARLRDENANLGLPVDSIDDENPQLLCKGIIADAILGSEEYSPREELTAEARAQGKTQGEPIKYADGTPVVSYKPRLISILGLSSVKVNAAF